VTGTVYLVGAGPGDPGLLTLRAARLLAAADVVVYDQLVGDAILDRLPEGVERVYAGKETGAHTMAQDSINGILEERARRGLRVVRLKGGDPFVFGRGGEEAEYLAARGIPFEVVPGVTSAIGVPAYAGIPVTHRGVAASLAVVTGRAGPHGEAPEIDWGRLAAADTLVLLMGVANQESLVRALVDGGRSPETPVAAIRWGTTAQQEVVVGTLATIGQRLRDAGLRPPAILVVGEVVGLRPHVEWASRRPLAGRRVLLLAPHPTPLTPALEERGAEVLHVPPVELGPPPSWAALDRALDELPACAGVVFADGIGVSAVGERLAARGRDARALAGVRIVAASPEAARRLRARGLLADAVVGETAADRVADGETAPWLPWLVVGRGDAQDLLVAALARRGGRALAPPVCTMATPKWRAERLREVLTSRPVDAIVFADPGEVRGLANALDPEERSALASATLVAVGEPTVEALARFRLAPAIRVADDAPDVVVASLMAALPGRSRDDGA
jgi:uroporphyrinogen III methyltransferase/synthase